MTLSDTTCTVDAEWRVLNRLMLVVIDGHEAEGLLLQRWPQNHTDLAPEGDVDRLGGVISARLTQRRRAVGARLAPSLSCGVCARHHARMRTEGVFYADSDATAAAVAEAAQAWSLRVPAVRLWAQVARDMLPEAAPARWTLEFDPQMKLVSFDVWAGDRRVYGADDFLG